MFACLSQNGEIVEELLQAGASPLLQDYEGSNALMHLCRLVDSPDPTGPDELLLLVLILMKRISRSVLFIASAMQP